MVTLRHRSSTWGLPQCALACAPSARPSGRNRPFVVPLGHIWRCCAIDPRPTAACLFAREWALLVIYSGGHGLTSPLSMRDPRRPERWPHVHKGRARGSLQSRCINSRRAGGALQGRCAAAHVHSKGRAGASIKGRCMAACASRAGQLCMLEGPLKHAPAIPQIPKRRQKR